MEETVFIRQTKSSRAHIGLKAHRYELPDDLVEEGAKRLAFVALMVAFIIGVTYIAFNLLGPGAAKRVDADQILLPMLILFSLFIWYAHRRKLFSNRKLIDIGYLYQIAIGAMIGLLIYQAPWPQDYILPSWSPIAVWIVTFSMLVPTTWGRAISAAVITGLMDPLTFLIMVKLGYTAIPENSHLMIQRFFPTVIAIGVVAFSCQIIYNLGAKVSEARKLGSYALQRLIGKGGMGEVWEAKHRMLARPAAVKLIRPESLGADDTRGQDRIRARFEREAQATAALQSPHTIGIYDFGTTKDGTFYYVMELLDGVDFETLIKRFGPIPAERVINLIRQACHSLAEAHDRGLVHRDIKPANLFSCRYGIEHDFVKVLDFGLVKQAEEREMGDAGLTAEGVATGTPAYMPPEMASSGPVDHRADIYGLGCVAYWLLTGHLVFENETPMLMVVDHIKTEPVTPSTRTELDVPAELDAAVLACLAKRPDDRPQTASELEALLAAVPVASEWNEKSAARWWGANLPVPTGTPAGEERA